MAHTSSSAASSPSSGGPRGPGKRAARETPSCEPDGESLERPNALIEFLRNVFRGLPLCHQSQKAKRKACVEVVFCFFPQGVVILAELLPLPLWGEVQAHP